MLTFLAPQFLFALPLAVIPLLMRRRVDAEVRRWSAMAILVRAARLTPWYRKRDLTTAIVRMTTILAIIVFFSEPMWTEPSSSSRAATILVSDADSPHIARALKTVRRQTAVARGYDLASPAVVLLGNTTDINLAGTIRFQRRDFASPREVILRAEDANHQITAPFAAHLEKFRVTLKSVWTLSLPSPNLRPVVVAEDAAGERFTLISQSATLPQIVVWHTSPEEAMSSLGVSPLFPALLDRCLCTAEGDSFVTPTPVHTTRWLQVVLLILVCVILCVDATRCNRSRTSEVDSRIAARNVA